MAQRKNNRYKDPQVEAAKSDLIWQEALAMARFPGCHLFFILFTLQPFVGSSFTIVLFGDTPATIFAFICLISMLTLICVIITQVASTQTRFMATFRSKDQLEREEKMILDLAKSMNNDNQKKNSDHSRRSNNNSNDDERDSDLASSLLEPSQRGDSHDSSGFLSKEKNEEDEDESWVDKVGDFFETYILGSQGEWFDIPRCIVEDPDIENVQEYANNLPVVELRRILDSGKFYYTLKKKQQRQNPRSVNNKIMVLNRDLLKLPQRTYFTTRYGHYFDCYRGSTQETSGRHWFIAADLASASILGVADGLITSFGCSAIGWILISIFGCYVLSLVILRPMVTRFEGVLVTVVGLLQLTAAVVAVLTSTDANAADPDSAGQQAVANITSAALITGTGQVLFIACADLTKYFVANFQGCCASKKQEKMKTVMKQIEQQKDAEDEKEDTTNMILSPPLLLSRSTSSPTAQAAVVEEANRFFEEDYEEEQEMKPLVPIPPLPIPIPSPPPPRILSSSPIMSDDNNSRSNEEDLDGMRAMASITSNPPSLSASMRMMNSSSGSVHHKNFGSTTYFPALLLPNNNNSTTNSDDILRSNRMSPSQSYSNYPSMFASATNFPAANSTSSSGSQQQRDAASTSTTPPNTITLKNLDILEELLTAENESEVKKKNSSSSTTPVGGVSTSTSFDKITQNNTIQKKEKAGLPLYKSKELSRVTNRNHDDDENDETFILPSSTSIHNSRSTSPSLPSIDDHYRGEVRKHLEAAEKSGHALLSPLKPFGDKVTRDQNKYDHHRQNQNNNNPFVSPLFTSFLKEKQNQSNNNINLVEFSPLLTSSLRQDHQQQQQQSKSSGNSNNGAEDQRRSSIFSLNNSSFIQNNNNNKLDLNNQSGDLSTFLGASGSTLAPVSPQNKKNVFENLLTATTGITPKSKQQQSQQQKSKNNNNKCDFDTSSDEEEDIL